MISEKHFSMKLEFSMILNEVVLSYIKSKTNDDAKYIPDVILSSLISLTNNLAATFDYTKEDVYKAVDAFWRD